jgi:hypothetical protein
MGIAGSASAHDHASSRETPPIATAARSHQASVTVRFDEDWLYEDCWFQEDCSGGACAEATVTRAAAASVAAVGVGQGDAVGQKASDAHIDNLISWGQGLKQWITPLVAAEAKSAADALVNRQPAKYLQAAATTGRSQRDRDLSDLTCEEPVDVTPATRSAVSRNTGAKRLTAVASPAPAADIAATEPPRFAVAALLGGSPVIATIPESYLPYDLSPEDAIAMRMYPIAHPQSSYLGARRTGLYAPVDGLAGSLHWHAVSEPAVTISSRTAVVTATEAAAQREAQQLLSSWANQAIAAVQPGSDVRMQLQSELLAGQLGTFARRGDQAVASAANNAVIRIASAWPAAPKRQGVPLWANAGPTDQQQIMQLELACRTAVSVVLAQAARQPQPAPASEITRAEALATACDQAAASLEKLAMAIRRAGDTVVRQAKMSTESQSLLR